VPAAGRKVPVTMNGITPAPQRLQSPGEEIANSVSHGVGLVAALVATPILLHAARRGNRLDFAGAAVFSATLVLLYLASTLYHALPRSGAKRTIRALDHSAVFLLIAGTYTPFAFSVLHGPLGWTLLAVEWSLATAGIGLTVVEGERFERLSTPVYVVMGWLIVFAVRSLARELPLRGVLWLVAGGLAYTAGVGFLTARRVRYGHFVWHLFVLVGSACHWVAIFRYAS
jgi:hemolysin III